MPASQILSTEDEAIRDHLERLDPRLLYVYLAWHGHFDGNASATQLKQYFISRGHVWANVDRSTFTRWMHKIETVICQCRA